ncbi:MAG: Omp28-related outer membrane protein [Saprospiraceae bacterium]
MKKLTLLFALALISFQLSAQQYNRRVMVEEFTQASCGPCASANPSFNATLFANADKVTPLKYQVWWPGFDPMYLHNTPDVDNRVAYYDVSGVPAGIESGSTEFYPGSYSAASIDAVYNSMTPVNIVVNHSFDAAYENVTVTVDVTSDDAISGNLRLRVAVAEREIVFATAPGSNGEKEFYDVMKKMLPSADGTETGDFAAGETKSYTFTWKMKNFYDLNEVEVVAWLQDDDTKGVWQSAISEPNASIPGGNFVSASVNAALASQITCDPVLAPAFILKNVGTDELTSATVSYWINNDPSATYDWSGSLMAGQSTAVTLPDVTFTDGGTNTLTIAITNTNNGAQINQVDAATEITVVALIDPTAPPVGDDFESGAFPAAGWGVKNEAGTGWTLSTAAGGYGASPSSARCNFYALTNGQTVSLYMPIVDLTSATGASMITWDHAHTYYSAPNYRDDRLILEVSTDCGATWDNLWDKIGDGLITAPPQTAVFVPNASQWVSDTVDVSNYNGSELMVRFRAVSGYGNMLYVDNINSSSVTSGTVALLPLSEFKVVPNPSSSNAQLRFNIDQPESIAMSVYNNLGVLVAQQHLGDLAAGMHTTQLESFNLPNGTYRVVLQGKQGVASIQWVVAK